VAKNRTENSRAGLDDEQPVPEKFSSHFPSTVFSPLFLVKVIFCGTMEILGLNINPSVMRFPFDSCASLMKRGRESKRQGIGE
jgi:hypothetical protein